MYKIYITQNREVTLSKASVSDPKIGASKTVKAPKSVKARFASVANDQAAPKAANAPRRPPYIDDVEELWDNLPV